MNCRPDSFEAIIDLFDLTRTQGSKFMDIYITLKILLFIFFFFENWQHVGRYKWFSNFWQMLAEKYWPFIDGYGHFPISSKWKLSTWISRWRNFVRILTIIYLFQNTNSIFSTETEIWLFVLIMSRTHFGVNPHSIVAWMSRNSLLETDAMSEV